MFSLLYQVRGSLRVLWLRRMCGGAAIAVAGGRSAGRPVVARTGVLRVLADGEEVAGGAGDRRVVFHRGQGVEDELALGGVTQPVLDTGCPVQHALDGQQAV